MNDTVSWNWEEQKVKKSDEKIMVIFQVSQNKRRN